MTDTRALGDYFERYSQASFGDEPNYVAVCAAVAHSPEVLALVAAHPARSHQPNMLLAAVHDLLLAGVEHPLATFYWPESGRSVSGSGTAGTGGVGAAFVDFVLANAEGVNERLATRFTQTNEAGRAALLAPLLDAASRSGTVGSLAWIDLGASAGLNLNLDRFRLDYRQGGAEGSGADGRTLTIGPADEDPMITATVRAGFDRVTAQCPTIGWRCGVDRSPLDVTDPADARWLRACLWPSANERRDRLDRAIRVFEAHPPTLLAADAADGLAQAISQAPADSHVVVSTTWVWYYLDEPTRSAVTAIMADAGRPVTWVLLEGQGVVDRLPASEPAPVEAASVLGVVTFPDATAVQLGWAHPHGAWLSLG